MAAKEKNLEDLFVATLKDMYSAEKAILPALANMAKAATSEELRDAFEKHRGETEKQVQRLDQVFELLDTPARAKTCDAIKGIIKETKEVMKAFKGSDALDAGLVAAAQAGRALRNIALRIAEGVGRPARLEGRGKLLDQPLVEEKKPDQLLTEIAVSIASQEAA